jgi:hypothetical protein
MKSEVVSIMLNGCTTLIWLIPAAGIIKARKIDDRFFIRQWLFPLQYWLQVLFEKMSGDRRIVVRILQIFFADCDFLLVNSFCFDFKVFQRIIY